MLFAAVSRDWDLIRHMIELYHQAKDIQVPQGWFDHLKEELQSYSSTTSPLANSIYLLQHHVHDPNTKPSEDFIKIAVAIDAHELVMIEIHTMVAHFRQHHLLQQPHSNSQTSINARNIIIHAAKTGSLDLLNEMAHHFIHNGVLATIDLKTVVMTAVSHGNLHIANIYLPYLHNIGLLKGNTSVELLEASLWSHNNKTILWAFHRMEECRLLSPELVNSMIRHHVGYNMLRYMLDWCGGAIVVGKDKGGVLLSPDALKVAVLFGGGEGLSSQ